MHFYRMEGCEGMTFEGVPGWSAFCKYALFEAFVR